MNYSIMSPLWREPTRFHASLPPMDLERKRKQYLTRDIQEVVASLEKTSHGTPSATSLKSHVHLH